ncbi:MAG TPA: glycyl-radical enzyme activating protein [candidate division Zixibacteria bacterium]|nr:glycyl-radical enzyme activating protein [candidate division Zixibacteria bacterium]
MSKKGIIFDIKRYAVHDGPGIRTTVFLKGCPMNCWWCHNPESQNQELEYIEANNNRINKTKETVGKLVTVEEIMKEIEKDSIFYKESGGGVTFSGGEPLFQIDFLVSLLKQCKKKGFHITLDTAGCADFSYFNQVNGFVDLYLYDLKLINDTKHIEYTSQSNNLILENLKKLSEREREIIIRLPIIPSINDSEEDLEELGKFIQKLKIIRVELLAFHTIGEEKYLRLNKLNRMKDIQPPTKERVKEIKLYLEKFGFQVIIEE